MTMSLILAAALIPQPASMTAGAGALPKAGARVAYAADASIPAEGYRLSVTADGVTVASSDEAGRFYAGQTLAQLEEAGAYPFVEIEDAPRYSWRGFHLDECRHFFGKETVKSILDLMARYKLNRFHWHLTEDQGWRVDVPGYPELVKYGAVRSASPRHGVKAYTGTKADAAKLNGVKYGPYYYTEADLREIVAYAAARHIQVVPEIELPGHVYAALAAYPQFACRPENLASREPRLVWGIEKDVLCLGNDEAIKFMENVLDWVCRVFPGDVVHIGGDECPQVRWQSCPKCQERIKKEGLGDHNGLQPWITRHFVKFLADRGKRTLGWDEYLLGDIPKSAIGMSWRESRSGAGHELVSGAAAAARGHDVVMTPCSYCYLDYGQGLKEDPFLYIGGKVTLERCYSFDPCAGVPEGARAHILGGQGNNWTEYTWNEYDLEWKAWPRMLALAEVFWLGEAKPGFADFVRRAAAHRRHLLAAHVNCAPVPEPPAAAPAAKPSAETLIAHRGESFDAPENTLPAYRTAVARGFGFECDIYLSKDGRVFTFHDRDLRRTTGGANTNACGDVAWDEVSKLDVGSWGRWKGSKFAGTRPALLEEVLELARDGRMIYVEVKTGPEIVPYVKKALAAQTKATPRNTLFISFNSASCRALKAALPEYKVYWLSSAKPGTTAERLVKGIRDAQADGVDCCFDPKVVTADLVQAVRAAGYEFHVWTIDDPAVAAEAFRRGAMTVTTNRAKELLEALAPEKR